MASVQEELLSVKYKLLVAICLLQWFGMAGCDSMALVGPGLRSGSMLGLGLKSSDLMIRV